MAQSWPRRSSKGNILSTLQQKIDNSLRIVETALQTAKQPIVAWSGGKDSNTVLWLVRQLNKEIPVWFFRENFQDHKFAFNQQLAEAWQLDVHECRIPHDVQLIGRADFLELLNVVVVDADAGAVIYLPTGTNDAEEPQADWACGCEVLTKETTEQPVWEWDCVLAGSRSDDVDPIQAALPLPDYTAQLGRVQFVYPLRDWTAADVWEAARTFGIPQNAQRYDLETGAEMPDRAANPDYMDVCVRCLQQGPTSEVLCPKAGRSVPRIGNQMDYEQNAQAWRQRFFNFKGA